MNESGITIETVAKWSYVKRDNSVFLPQRLEQEMCNSSSGDGVCFRTAGHSIPDSEEPTVHEIALFHYATKSLEDFREKMRRGSGLSRHTKGIAYFEEIAWCAAGPND